MTIFGFVAVALTASSASGISGVFSGSNWELLCIYCHDNEHSRDQVADAYSDEVAGSAGDSGGTTNPFAGLGEMLKGKL